MSIILDGFVDSNLLITEGLGTGFAPFYTPVILEFSYDLSEIITTKPSSPFTIETLSAVIKKGTFLINKLPMKPSIGESITIKLSKVTATYLDTSNILSSMGLKDINIWTMLNSDKSVIIKIGAFKGIVYSSWDDLIPNISNTGLDLKPIILGIEE